MYHIDPTDGTPLYTQLLKLIAVRISTGILKPGDKLPSIRELAVETGINPNTVSKSYKELERNNLIFTVAGKGSFVSESAIENSESILFSDFDNAVEGAIDAGISKDMLIKRINLKEEAMKK